WLLAGIPFAKTNYAGVSGDNYSGVPSLWDAGCSPKCHRFDMWGTKECPGAFWGQNFLAPVSLASFRDGASNTFIIGEVVPEYCSFTYWTISNASIESTSM